MITTLKIRAMRAADTPLLAGVLRRAYQSEQNFAVRLAGYTRMHAVATFVAEVDGLPVGMVVGNDYGPIAYVSQMGVDPAMHRRGIGTALMDALIAWADARGFAAVELDATASGAPLYVRYGFVNCGETTVYIAGEAGGADVADSYVTSDRTSLFAADERAFGADRSDVLGLLIAADRHSVFVSRAEGVVDGYAVAQPGSGLMGPVVAASTESAGRLIDAARMRLPAGHRISVPADNGAIQNILTTRGYRNSRSLAHMVRGTRPVAAAREALFARINLGQG